MAKSFQSFRPNETGYKETAMRVLESSPMFHFSLSSKELFHSNFIGWIASLNLRDGSPAVRKIFSFDEGNFETLREKNNLDLALCREGDTEGKKGYLLVIENKLKSVPDKNQLKRYDNDKSGITEKTKRILLTLMNYFPDREDIEARGWQIMTYKELCAILRKQVIPELIYHNCYIENIISDYCDFTEALVYLTEAYVSEGNYFIPADEENRLKKLRIYDLIDKIRFSAFAAKLKSEISDASDIRTGYGHGQAMLEIWYPCHLDKNTVDSNKNPSLVIQVQGNRYAHCIYPCSHLSERECVNRYPEFFKSSINDFQSSLAYGKVFTMPNKKSTKIFGKYESRGDSRMNYQYTVISRDATMNDITEWVKSDLEIMKQSYMQQKS